jgi:hypothetical protein
MISMLTWTARRLRRTVDSIATPCSVNAYGVARRCPPQLLVAQLKHEVGRKTFRVALHGLNEGSRQDAVELGQMRAE